MVDVLSLSVSEAARKLAVTPSRVRQLIMTGALVPVLVGKRGNVESRVAVKDVEALVAQRKHPPPPKTEVKRTEGAIAQSVFALFEEGKTLSQVVLTLALPPSKVRALYREWQAPLQKDVQFSAEERDRRSREEHDQFQKDFERECAERNRRHEEDHRRRMKEIDEIRKPR